MALQIKKLFLRPNIITRVNIIHRPTTFPQLQHHMHIPYLSIASAPSIDDTLSDNELLSRCVKIGSEHLIEFAIELSLIMVAFHFIINGGLKQNKFNIVLPNSDNEYMGIEYTDESELASDSTTLADVAGIDKAKNEVMEVIDFIRNPELYNKLGAKMPKGVLLSGPPGCGKTLLARAVAGEAGVPMIVASGSEFIEMYVGVGAKRIREIFEEAKKMAPCIIFIDEIDSIGIKRGGSQTSNNAEQDQTINQLLTAMDGFVKNSGIIVIAATNRTDILDEALLRPGRFDRNIHIGLPNYRGRIDILKVHTFNKPLDNDVSLDDIARMTQRFSGADLENLCNEAAIAAARLRRPNINMSCIENALDRILLGIDTGAVLTEKQRRTIAYHEAGHALMGLIAYKFGDYDAVRKVSIIPRGDSGGITLFKHKDEADIGLFTQEYLKNMLMVALGGRIAEEIVFGRLQTTTGAYSDFQQVHHIARMMIAYYGFSETLGQLSWTENIGEAKTNEIDDEISFLVNWSERKATELMTSNEATLHAIAKALLDKGELDENELNEIFENS